MKVEVEDYLADMKDHNYAMKINYFGSVEETKQVTASQNDFRLRTSVLEISGVRILHFQIIHIILLLHSLLQ